MPFNGSGMFVRVRNWVADAAAGIKIRADFHDIEDDGFADGLSHCIARDGQSIIINNIPMNSKRLTSLADPTDPQDASTKAYADTKLPLTGGTITGNLTVTGNIDVGGYNSAHGYRTRTGMAGSYGGNYFNFNWTGSVLVAWVDNSNIGALATQDYAEGRASAWAATRLPLAGGTITGSLTVNSEMIAAANYLRFGYSGGPGYIIWNGGGSYTLGGGGNVWHTGNLNPVQSVRLVNAGQGGSGPVPGCVVTGGWLTVVSGPTWLIDFYYRRLQYLTPGGWVTVEWSG